MNGPWPFLGIGLLLLGLVFLLLLRSRVSARGDSESTSIDYGTTRFQVELFPQELAARLFGLQDWEFVAKQGSARLRRLFLKQRTGLALSLLHAVCANATKLLGLHSAAARSNSRLKPLVEIRVVADYLFIQILCRVLALLIWLRGPVDLFRLVGYADDRSKHLYGLTMKIFPAGLTTEGSKRE